MDIKTCNISKKANTFIDTLFEKSYTPMGDLECTAYVTDEPVTFEERESGRKAVLRTGDKWADKVFDCAWFHITGKVPAEIDRSNTVFLINCGGEGLICDKNGVEK